MRPRILATAAACLLAAGCGAAPTVTATPDPPKRETTADPAAQASPAAQTATVGDTITLNGSDPALKVAVTPTRVVKKGRPANELVAAGDGKRLFAVVFQIKNVGERAYDDSPANGANVVDDEGQSYEASLFGEVAGLHNLGSVTISPGGTRKGAVVFEVPENAKIVTLQVALDSGFAQHTGEWALP